MDRKTLLISVGIPIVGACASVAYFFMKKQSNKPPDEEFSVTTYHIQLTIPSSRVSAVIGRSGTVIKDIQRKTNTRIIISKPEGDSECRHCKIIGTEIGCRAAEAMVQKIISSNNNEVEMLWVPTHFLRYIIGRGGYTLKTICSSTNTIINIKKDNLSSTGCETQVIIRGNKDNVCRAIQEINEIVHYHENRDNWQMSENKNIQSEETRIVCHENQDNLESSQNEIDQSAVEVLCHENQDNLPTLSNMNIQCEKTQVACQENQYNSLPSQDQIGQSEADRVLYYESRDNLHPLSNEIDQSKIEVLSHENQDNMKTSTNINIQSETTHVVCHENQDNLQPVGNQIDQIEVDRVPVYENQDTLRSSHNQNDQNKDIQAVYNPKEDNFQLSHNQISEEVENGKNLKSVINETEDAEKFLEVSETIEPVNNIQTNWKVDESDSEIMYNEEIPEGIETLNVFVSSVNNPSQFWIQNKSSDSFRKIEEMHEEMNKFYNSPIGDSMIITDLSEVKIDLYVAAPFENQGWFRAEVLDIQPDEGDISNSLISVGYVDYCDQNLLKLKDVRFLRSDFMNLKIQAIECALVNILPKGDEWTMKAIEKFEGLVFLNPSERTVHIDKNRNVSTPLPITKLIVTHQDKMIDVADELVQGGFAVYREN